MDAAGVELCLRELDEDEEGDGGDSERGGVDDLEEVGHFVVPHR